MKRLLEQRVIKREDFREAELMSHSSYGVRACVIPEHFPGRSKSV